MNNIIAFQRTKRGATFSLAGASFVAGGALLNWAVLPPILSCN